MAACLNQVRKSLSCKYFAFFFGVGLLATPGLARGQAFLIDEEHHFATTEATALRFDEKHRRRDANAAKSQIKNLGQRQTAVSVFLAQGVGSARSGATFRTEIQTRATEPLVAEALAVQVPKIPAQEFAEATVRTQAIDGRGTLVEPPPALVSIDSNSELSRARQDFESLLLETLDQAASGESPTRETIKELRVTLASYRAVAEKNIEDVDHSEAFQAKKYLKSLGVTVSQLSDPARREQLLAAVAPSQARSNQSIAFAGGTVAELVDHIVTRRLKIKSGGVAQASLAPLAEALVAGIRADVSDAELVLARTREETPAKNAGLRERIKTPPTIVVTPPRRYGYYGGYAHGFVIRHGHVHHGHGHHHMGK